MSLVPITPLLAENIDFSQFLMIADPDFCHTDFAPAGLDAAGHMLEVIVIEKDTLQVVDDHVNCPVGSIPNLTVIGATGCSDPDVYMSLLEIWETDTSPIVRLLAEPKSIIKTFLNSVFVYDDKVVLTFNYSGDNRTMTLHEIDGGLGHSICIPSAVVHQKSPDAFASGLFILRKNRRLCFGRNHRKNRRNCSSASSSGSHCGKGRYPASH